MKHLFKLLAFVIIAAFSSVASGANASTSLAMNITYFDSNGVRHKVTVDLSGYISHPTKRVACDGFDEKGRPCTLDIPDYSLWYNLSNWQSYLPVTTQYVNADGVNIVISQDNIAARWNNAFVEAAIANEKANHKCVGKDEEKPEEEKHDCDKYREGNCVCGYVFEKTGKKHGAQLEHLPGKSVGGCKQACGFEDCVFSIDVTHTATSPVDDFNHACDCGRPNAAEHLRGCTYSNHEKEELSSETINGKTIKTFRCTGANDSCDHIWTEEKPAEHEHIFVKWNGAEICRELVYDEDGNYWECSITHPHNYEKDVGQCHVNCLNDLTDGSPCGETQHGGFWHYLSNKKHCCDCGGEQRDHVGKEETEEVVMTGTDGKEHVYTKHTIHCAASPSGCGESVVWYTGGNGVPPTPDPGGGNEDEEEDCTKGHDIITVNGCDFCMRPKCEHSKAFHNFTNDRSHHNLSPANSLDGSTWETSSYPPILPKFKGHDCACMAYKEEHNFGAEVSASGERLVRTCTDCNFKIYYPDRRNCKHINENGESYRYNDVCLHCSTNFEHSLSILIPGNEETKTCSYLQCSHLNGYAEEVPEGARGERCAMISPTENGTHYGWSDCGDDENHICACSAEVMKPHKKKLFKETDPDGNEVFCSRHWECEVCTWKSQVEHFNVGWQALQCGGRITNIYKCRFCNKVSRKTYKDGKPVYVDLQDDSPANHYFNSSCVCDCGTFTEHHYPNETAVVENWDFCGCYCGENTEPHQQKINGCVCFGKNSKNVQHTPIEMVHMEPLHSEEFEFIEDCSVCTNEVTNRKVIYSCKRCGKVPVKVVSFNDDHLCSGKHVSGAKYYLAWKAYQKYNFDTGAWEHIGAAEEFGDCSSGGIVKMNNWAGDSVLNFSGGTIDIEKSGLYRLTATIDETGSVTVGSITASNGPTWDAEGTPVEGYLEKGKVPVSGNAVSKEGLIQIHYKLEFVR